jgi:hypothetical protein
MSSNIWTPDELSSSVFHLKTTAWRVVEAQHRVSTMKLIDSLEEQKILEEVLDQTKPPVPPDYRGLHYLLFTPFRYAAALPRGSRFRRGGMTQGVFYASAATETAIAEVAFYRLLFFAESPGTPVPTNPAEYTAFAVQIAAKHAIDLTRAPFNRHKEFWTAPHDYSQCQTLADAARVKGIEVICYASVRDPKHRLNYAVLEHTAFAQLKPVAFQTWRIHMRKDGVLAKCEAPDIGLAFTIADFSGDDRLAVLKDAAD